TAFGQQGVKAERVAADAAEQANEYLAAGVPGGRYLADQILLPLGISAWQGGADDPPAETANLAEPRRARGGSFRTLELPPHATPHIELLREFLSVTIAVDPPDAAGVCTVRVGS